MNNKPRFEHDCNACKFYGQARYQNNNVDVYLCQTRENVRTIICRYGNDGPEYFSGGLFECVILTSLDKFALLHGIELTDTEKDRLLQVLLGENKARWAIRDYNDYPDEDEKVLGNCKWYED